MIPPTGTRVGAVIDALVAAFGAVGDDVTVLDGPKPTTPKGSVIAVGVGNESVIVRNTKAPGLQVAYVEEAHIVCSLWSWSGSSDVKARRDRCVQLLDAVRDVLDNDPRLGGVCDLAVLGPDHSWQQLNGADGASCAVGFSVAVKTNI